jgi:hypothetical protein
LERGSAQSAFVKDVLKAAFQVHAALAQKRFARVALDGTGGTMKSFAQRSGQTSLRRRAALASPMTVRMSNSWIWAISSMAK